MEKTHAATAETACNMIVIAVTGPESSGKTALARELSTFYNAELVEEYAREYLTGIGREYTRSDLDIISKKQLEIEDEAFKAGNPVVICDTDIIVLKIWYADKYGLVPDWLNDSLTPDRYSLHLLTAPDLPYENDPLRENPDRGEYFFEEFRSELEDNKLPYSIIRGQGPERIEKAKKAINEIIDSPSSG